MPEAQKITRELLHTREILCQGYLRSDGLLDIEGRLRDVPALTSDLPFFRVEADQPVHDMRLVMTLDDQMVIQAIVATTDAGATPVCSQITSAYTQLKGLKVAPGFKQQIKDRVGGVEGCTHLTELVERMASAAIQVRFTLGRVQQSRVPGSNGSPAQRAGWVVDTCYAYRRGGEVVRLLNMEP